MLKQIIGAIIIILLAIIVGMSFVYVSAQFGGDWYPNSRLIDVPHLWVGQEQPGRYVFSFSLDAATTDSQKQIQGWYSNKREWCVGLDCHGGSPPIDLGPFRYDVFRLVDTSDDLPQKNTLHIHLLEAFMIYRR